MHMIIILKGGVDPQYAPVSAAHASLACYLKWGQDELMQSWANGVFNKHVKMATPEEFEKAKCEKYGDKIVLTESAINNEEVAIVYRLKEKYSGFLDSLPKWKVKICQCATKHLSKEEKPWEKPNDDGELP